MDLRKLIENYTPFNEQEAKDKQTILMYFDTFEDLLTRNNEIAHFSSSSFVVNKERTKCLMIYHNIYNSWSWTGGHADGDSDLFHVAVKELNEETGITNFKPVSEELFAIDIVPVLGHFKRGKYVSGHVHLSACYLIEADENQELIVRPDENSGVEWIAFEDLDKKVSEPHMLTIYHKCIEKIKTLNM